MHAEELLKEYALISDQVSSAQLETILRELEIVLDHDRTSAVVEFGCYIGTTSLFIRRLLDARGESPAHAFHVYDSFEGLPEKSDADQSMVGEQFQAGELRASKKEFLHEFRKANLHPPIVHKGWFDQLSPADLPDPICFAFLDGDFYESIQESLQLVLPNLAKSATLVIDDYAHEALPGAAKAVHDFLPAEWQTKIIIEHNLAIIRT